MTPSRRRLALACLVCAIGCGCGDPRLIGRTCPDDDCEGSGVPVLVPDCGVQLHAEPLPVPGLSFLERCELFTLDALPPAGLDGQIYLTGAEVTMTPIGHHLDISIADPAYLTEYLDGRYSCSELLSRAVPWVPILLTQGGGEIWDSQDAPLVASPNDRLLVIQNVFNEGDGEVMVGVTLDVRCTQNPPAQVSQVFEFTNYDTIRVDIGQTGHLDGFCAFEQDVVVSRLYRRRHLITGFRVHTEPRTEPDPLNWSSDLFWTFDVDPPLPVAAGHGFAWDCLYDNDGEYASDGDPSFSVDGSTPDACSLLGFYQLPNGGEDDTPDYCSINWPRARVASGE